MAAEMLDARTPEHLLRVATLLREGGVVVVPTETLYGVAASVFRPDAIERVFEVKERDASARVPILLPTAADLPILVESVPPVAWVLIQRFWPGPLTLALPARRGISPSITRGGGTVAVRVPSCRPCLALLEALGEPIIATSANISGMPPATTAADAFAALGDRVDAVLAADPDVGGGAPSTVAEVQEDRIIVHRSGAVDTEAIREAVGPRTRVVS